MVRDGSGPRWTPLFATVSTTRQSWPGAVDVEPYVAVLVRSCAGPVVARQHAADQPGFDDLGGERIGELDVLHSLRLAQHRADLASIVAAEVAADALTQVGGLADVEDAIAVPQNM